MGRKAKPIELRNKAANVCLCPAYLNILDEVSTATGHSRSVICTFIFDSWLTHGLGLADVLTPAKRDEKSKQFIDNIKNYVD